MIDVWWNGIKQNGIFRKKILNAFVTHGKTHFAEILKNLAEYILEKEFTLKNLKIHTNLKLTVERT